jgi:hypothetical protein
MASRPGPHEDDSPDETLRLVARRQSEARERNDGLRRARDASLEIRCECGWNGCDQLINVPRAEYERIRRRPRRFALDPAHVMPDTEAIVGMAEGYVVVEKRPGPGAAAAETLPPARRFARVERFDPPSFRRIVVPEDNVELACSRSSCHALLSVPPNNAARLEGATCPTCGAGLLVVASHD